MIDIGTTAYIVCVDFADILALTLPYNRNNFERIVVVTSLGDHATREVAKANGCSVYVTNAFYANGADFNKWLALEEALDAYGRSGWLCFLDCDIVVPKELPHYQQTCGTLVTPYRRMMVDFKGEIPPESEWSKFPRHRQEKEFAGYFQVFHGSDTHLGETPWHQTNWRHAGGADSFFQRKWPEHCKIRPPFEVLHLGPAGQNWCGRTTPDVKTGRVPPNAKQRQTKLTRYMLGRRRPKPDRFSHEKLDGN